MITVTHNGDDITDSIDTSSFSITDERNDTRDTLSFSIDFQPGGFKPLLNAEIIVTLDDDRIFGGSILSLESSVEAPPTVRFEVECIDFTRQLDRKLVTERFIDFTIAEIIDFIIDKYTTGFTQNGVTATQNVSKISFNRLTVSECLEKLAKLNNFNWYVDYDKDIHFFARAEEKAPFNLADNSNNYIVSSLKIKSDLSQLRNLVQVEGAEVPISERTTLHAGDGETTEFATNFKFATKPVVEVDGIAQTVGTEFLDVDGFDCYWSFQQKYIRFDDTNIPPAPGSGTTNIELTGNPLVPLVAVVPDSDSIDEYGEFEYSVVEKTLESQDQTIDRGIAEIEAKAREITDAKFDTYTPGLRSGQLIEIDSDLHGVDDDYVVQSVVFRPFPNGSSLDGIWTVKLASASSLTLIDALRALLRQEDLQDDELKTLLAFYRFSDSASGSDSVDTPETTEKPYLLANGAGVVVGGDPFICNYAVMGPAS